MVARTNLTEAEALFIQQQRVARLATADAEGHPHVVPVCYAFDGARFYIAARREAQARRRRQLKRVRNIEARPEVSLVIDRYEDDWSRLGYVQVAAHAELLGPDDAGHAAAIVLLRERYRTVPHDGAGAEPDHRADAHGGRPRGASRLRSPRGRRIRWLEPGRGLDFLPLARGRQSVRAFQDRPVPREALEEMIEAARWAPSPHGAPAMALRRADSPRAEARAGGGDGRRLAAHLGDGR